MARPHLVMLLSCVLTAGLLAPAAARAQTDYYNTDRGRPVQVEDAYVTERYAFELKLAPVRLERADGGHYAWGVQPEIALGILPRTSIELGVPLAFSESGDHGHGGIAGLELSAMHNFNVETEGVPALALRGDIHAPVGPLGPDRAYASLTGMATRTWPQGRLHLNAQATAGTAPDLASAVGTGDLSRWLIGAAIDRTAPLRSVLVTAELYARQPIVAAEPVEYTAGVGSRFQLTPRLALDGGIGRRLNGAEQGWYVTAGSALAFGVRSLFPGAR